MAPEITVRPWHRRRDRSAIEHWPRPELPGHWSTVLDSTTGQRQSWAIDQVGDLVGRLTLRGIGDDQATIGIYLRPDKYGQGIGTAALIAFRQLSPVNYLLAEVAVDNRRARRCYEKAGFLQLQTINNYQILGLYLAPYRTISCRAVGGNLS